MADLFEGYPAEAAATAAWDEVFEASNTPRDVYAALYDALQPLSSADLAARKVALDRAFRDAGITFNLFGEERPFPLDLVPRLLAGDEWDVIERGVTQRVQALEAFLADVYGPAEVLADGIVPRRLVLTSAHFHRAAHGIDPPNGVRAHVSGIDLIRDEQGGFRVLEDNVR
ncbi:circularly permuted type 2 ATP-grasp protein, partial [Frankia sp. ACN1ag]|uniref:circularly permuted type 2 ATP-grasp protein n=2 Tax=unclassified Frankia TaxID=2632575 RepID=UPI0037BFD349